LSLRSDVVQKRPYILIVLLLKNVLNIFRWSLHIVGCCKPYVWCII